MFLGCFKILLSPVDWLCKEKAASQKITYLDNHIEWFYNNFLSILRKTRGVGNFVNQRNNKNFYGNNHDNCLHLSSNSLNE